MTKLPTGLLLAAAFVTMALPMFVTDANAATTPTPIKFGMDSAAVSAQAAAGVPADYGTFWIGPWTLSSGWGGPDAQLTAMKNAGVAPAIHFYYWGDDISPSCVENGCWSSLHNAQKTRAGWETLGVQLTDHLNAKMGGAPAVVFLESEFNKGGIETYEPFDGYMAAMAAGIHERYPAAIIVLGFGNWGSVHWKNYDRAAAESDMVGIQGMRGSTKQSQADMYTLYDGLLAGVKTLGSTFPGKAIMLTDIAVSSHPEPSYLGVQDGVLKEVLGNLATLKSLGVQAIIYRSWKDSPNMDLANYYGEAERHWGLAWAGNGTMKAAGKTWVDAVKAERSGSGSTTTTSSSTTTTTAAPVPIAAGPGTTTQAEAFATKTAGGKQSDASADGGAVWNLWSNGAVSQAYDGTGTLDLVVRARGTAALGVNAHMDVYVGGTKVLSADPGATYQEFTVTVTLAGRTDVKVQFTNDAKTASEDRNLLVDTVGFRAPPPPNQAPQAAIQVAIEDLSLQADGSGSMDPDGTPLVYAWSFGDGATATGPTASHAYAQAGTYTVTLTVSDGKANASASQSVRATAPNQAPTAAFTTAGSGLSVSLDGAGSSDPDGDALVHSWSFGDGGTATGPTATHAYASAGSYTVTLTVSDGRLADTATRTFTAVVPNRAPAAAFTATASGLTASVDASSATDPDGDVLSYAWSFGDGTVGSGRTASHGYAASGTYTVTLTVSDGQASASASKTVTVTKPVVAFAPTVSPKGNEWWVEASVKSDRAVSKVEAKAGTGAWVTLDLKSWGAYAKSFNVPKGTIVTFRVTAADGSVAQTAGQSWLVDMAPKAASPAGSATTTSTPPTSATTTTTAATSTSAGPKSAFKASFAPKAQGNDWWVEVDVDANHPVRKVEAKVNSGAWVELPLKDWGHYGKTLNAPDGAKVTFRATSATTGTTVTSATYTW